ncbi:MAG: helix-turn-helix transcriptional regulator [Clostridia bacterium]|nr:helix-turn-helix transcriptional regulator [Clostridia bacterium]
MNNKNRANYISVIKGIMIERDLSQEKFAKELDINQTTVSQWLLGKKKPSYDNILAICVKFDITPNDFFGF